MNFEVLITKPSPTSFQQSQSHSQNDQRHHYPHQARPSSATTSSTHVSDEPALQDPLPVLLSLAESYFDTAQRNASKPGFDRDGYNSLMSTGFNCLAASLLHFKLQPKLEVLIRLRYASLLHDETDNYVEVEEILHKGVLIAQKNNFLDLKYKMQYLLIRAMFAKSPKAALLMLKEDIETTEQLNIIHWTYTLRFLLSFLRVSSSTGQDDSLAIEPLRQIQVIASKRNDYHIFMLSCLLEAAISLNNGAAGTRAAKKCLSRVEQINVNDVPQLQIFRQVLDCTASILECSGPESKEKVKALHEFMEKGTTWTNGADSGDFTIPVQPGRQGREPELLTVQWLSKVDIWILGYYLGGVSRLHESGQDSAAEKHLMQCLKALEGILHLPGSMHQIYNSERVRINNSWHHLIRLFTQIQLTFLLCGKREYISAVNSLRYVQAYAEQLEIVGSSSILKIRALVRYIHGLIYQGTGDLRTAINYYKVPDAEKTNEIGIMSTLNLILILAGSTYKDSYTTKSLLASIESVASTHPHILIQGAFNLVSAALEGPETANLMRKHLSLAQRTARQFSNNQMLSLILGITCRRIHNPDPKHNLNLSRAAYMCAVKAADPMWSSICGYMVSNSFSQANAPIEAESYKAKSDKYRADVEQYLNLPAENRL